MLYHIHIIHIRLAHNYPESDDDQTALYLLLTNRITIQGPFTFEHSSKNKT